MPIKIQSGFSTIIVVIVIIVLAGTVLSGIYYYTEIYQPAQYAKAIISLFDGVGAALQRSDERVDGTTSPADALKVLKVQQEFLSQAQNKLLKFTPPTKMKQVHQDFTQTLEGLIDAQVDIEKRVNFLKDLTDLRNSVYLDGILRLEPKPKTGAELKTRLNSYFPKAKTIAKKLFAEEPPQIRGEITVSKLKNSWQNTESSLDFLLTFVSSLDQNLPLDKLSAVVDQNKEVNEAADKIEKFIELCDDVFSQNSLGIIFSSSFFNETLPKDLQDVTQRLSSAIQYLKRKYP